MESASDFVVGPSHAGSGNQAREVKIVILAYVFSTRDELSVGWLLSMVILLVSLAENF